MLLEVKNLRSVLAGNVWGSRKISYEMLSDPKNLRSFLAGHFRWALRVASLVESGVLFSYGVNIRLWSWVMPPKLTAAEFERRHGELVMREYSDVGTARLLRNALKARRPPIEVSDGVLKVWFFHLPVAA